MGNITNAVGIELVIVGFIVMFYLPLCGQRLIRFNEEGISFIRFFSRRFLRWNEIMEVSNVSLNSYPVLQLSSKV